MNTCSKIMELAKDNYSGSKEEISEKTGIPTGKTSGKVVPHILYAQYMGLTTYTLTKGKSACQKSLKSRKNVPKT